MRRGGAVGHPSVLPDSGVGPRVPCPPVLNIPLVNWTGSEDGSH